MAHRQNTPGGAYDGLTVLRSNGPQWTGEVRLVHELLDRPLHWKRPREIFVDSMSDLFHDDVPDSFINKVWCTMTKCHWHTFIVLTKRAERMRHFCETVLDADHPLSNVVLGTTCENQEMANRRLPELERTPAAIRVISAEPLLSYIDFNLAYHRGIHGIIVGGESGAGSEPVNPSHVVSIREQCEHWNVAFFFKQWGGYPKSRYGRELDGRTYDALPWRRAHDCC